MKKLFVVVITVLLVTVGWINVFSRTSNRDIEEKVEYYKSLAVEQIELGAYGSAVQYYQNIIEMFPAEDYYLELAEIYRLSGKDRAYKETLEEAVSTFPGDVRAYEQLAAYYCKADAYQDCVDVVRKAQGQELLNETLLEDYYKTAYQYGVLTTGLGEAGRFYNNYAVIQINGKYQYMNSSMETDAVQYEQAAPYISMVTGVTLDGKTYYIDEKKEKYLDNKEGFEQAFAYSENISVVIKGGKYYFVNASNQITGEGYDMATLFKNGIAAVASGGKWKLIDTSGEAVNQAEYADVLIDEDNVCSSQGVVFVSEGKGYYMVDTKGKRISEEIFEDAEPFFESGITAVQKDGKWGFIDTKGTIIIEPQYEDARSFGRGIGAVQKDGMWGFVNSENRMVIAPVFEDAKCFSDMGIAPVKINGGWGYIKLYVEN